MKKFSLSVIVGLGLLVGSVRSSDLSQMVAQQQQVLQKGLDELVTDYQAAIHGVERCKDAADAYRRLFRFGGNNVEGTVQRCEHQAIAFVNQSKVLCACIGVLEKRMG